MENKTLLFLLVLTIAISLLGTAVTLSKVGKIQLQPLQKTTGLAQSDIGNVTLNIQKNASLIFVINSVNWSSGSVDTLTGYCELWTNLSGFNSAGCIGFSTVTENQTLVIENDGQVHLNVTLNSSVNATGFMGETGAMFQWKINENETNSCFGGTVSPTTFTNVSVAPAANICDMLNFTDTKDTLRVDLFVNFTINAPQGQKNATFTALGTQTGT
ncbi:hypothetical protein C4573_04090 [Candidatus Woesearchaeota archaeon]|nr:MAG: hypothetical protein C4573_04090 [Candidatus Woesearchaeota archaeon]